MQEKTIREIRIKRGLTQVELGERLGVKQRTISRWEKFQDYPTLPQAMALAKNLEIELEELAECFGLIPNHCVKR